MNTIDKTRTGALSAEMLRRLQGNGALRIPVTPTNPPRLAVRVLEMDVCLPPSNRWLPVAHLVCFTGNGVEVLTGVPAEESVVPAPHVGMSPVAIVRVGRAQDVVFAGDIEEVQP